MRANPARSRHILRMARRKAKTAPIPGPDEAAEALSRSLADLARLGSVHGQQCWLIGVPVGQMDSPIPVGTELANCGECRRPLWVTGNYVAAIGRGGLTPRPICPACVSNISTST